MTEVAMSEHYVQLVPADAHFIPGLAAQQAVVALLRELWPQVGEIDCEVAEQVVYRDCGENFERVGCPHCGAELDIAAWHALMDADYCEQSGGFALASQTLPCCAAVATVNELDYAWPQAFSRFAVIAQAPGGLLEPALLTQLEALLGCPLRVIYRMC